MSKEQDALQFAIEDFYLRYGIDVARLSEQQVLVMHYYLEGLSSQLQEVLGDRPIANIFEANSRIYAGQSAIATVFLAMEAEVTGTLYRLATLENTVASNAMGYIGINVSREGLSEFQLRRLVDNTLIEGSVSAQWWKTQSVNIQDRFARAVRLGYAQGLGMKDITAMVIGSLTGMPLEYWNPETGRINTTKKRMNGVLPIARRDLDALVRTSVQAISEEARRDALDEFEDVLQGYIWLSTLDHRTTPMCRARDKKKYLFDGTPVGHSLLFLGGPPIHFCCRSTTLPWLKDWKTLGIDDDKIAEILEGWANSGERASIDGPVPATWDYNDWFQSQPVSIQKDILGAKRWQIWKSQGLTFEEMVDVSGRPLTIKQLEERYS